MNRLRLSRRQFVSGLASAAAGFPCVGRAASYDTGATDREIRIGNTTAYSGPISQFGALGHAMAAYFKLVNDKGGVNGREIRFLSLDDAYSPPKTVEQTRKLIEADGVLFMAASVGTPTQAAVQQYLNDRKVPQLFLLGGSSRWGKPTEFPWTMGWSPTYAAEASVYAKYILQAVPDARIGVLYANDDFGKDYLEGLRHGLGSRTAMIVSQASTQTTDATVDSQILQLKGSGANVLLNAAGGKGAAQAIRRLAELNWKPLHFINSNSAGVETFLKPVGLENATGLVTANYRKDPTDAAWANDPGVLEWKAWMAKYNPSASPGNELYAHGYSVAQTIVQVIRQCGDNLTRSNVMKQAASLRGLQLPLLLPGVVLNTSETDYFPMKTLRLARFNGTKWQMFGENITP